MDTQKSILPQLFGVMVDEHEDAHPLSGIEQAFLVIEAPTEAGIPRLLAFFTNEQEVEKIGPVRSARPYFVEMVQAWDAVYAHVGGSLEALASIEDEPVKDLNQYWNGSFFWRSWDRFAPHNVYTSSEFLRLFAGEEDDPIYETWTFKDSAKEVPPEASSIFLDFSFYSWGNTTWKFDSKRHQYQRFLGEHFYPLENGAEIFADNVVILFTDIEIVDDMGRRRIRTTGEGEGYVLQDGQIISIIWKRPENKNIPRFYAEGGEEIALNAGTTWIEVMPDSSSVLFSDL
ncbi:MAG: PEGA domain protein [Candidatus Uhrbacteria bacterium GW2011_GWE2_46_68]|uniref:PEGA domain protein n=2 Tax=Candidatus Uhriibacteriota TaxID=1752732 RepID=A0A0G1SF48_9BACT|nr:MAG: PEGA domain protein [Candidatus Uhrbacteria bacterium GW2011_GWF2_46_218]KKU40683.1 MAG: PEGA domain protein [Candidatus Uhrbacteria bacterium GW2011_GWE2_46_68]